MERARNKKKYILHKEIRAFTCTKRKKKKRIFKISASHSHLLICISIFISAFLKAAKILTFHLIYGGAYFYLQYMANFKSKI